MGGRQSVQTDDNRRPRSSSVIEAASDVTPERNRHREGAHVSGVSSSEYVRRRIGSHSSSGTDEDFPRGLAAMFSVSPERRRSPSSRLSVPHLRIDRGIIGGRETVNRRSVPLLHILGLARDIRCPVCKKSVPSDEAEVHLVMCLTRPKITYNEETLAEDKGECAICFEEMLTGEVIARLPCLCIYHKHCIDEWFARKNCCPEHPGDD
ncbi:hypothetical protein AB6A40_004824 [Gnathostoma spinigerum]|uniref:RING-type E3 ubiquitin transferase n=1 Tax=Gnathostoma spinigerum TaxID=75299 RepID=A0ABD6EET7_9BILA